MDRDEYKEKLRQRAKAYRKKKYEEAKARKKQMELERKAEEKRAKQEASTDEIIKTPEDLVAEGLLKKAAEIEKLRDLASEGKHLTLVTNSGD